MDDSLTKAMMEYPAAEQLAREHGYEFIQVNSGQYDLVAPVHKGKTRLVIYPRKHYVYTPRNNNTIGVRRWPCVMFDRENFNLINIVEVAIQTLEDVLR